MKPRGARAGDDSQDHRSANPVRVRTQGKLAALAAGTITLALAIAVSSWIFTIRMTEYGGQQERHDLAALAAAAAASLDPQTVALLRGDASDAGGAALAAIQQQLRRIHQAIPRSRFVYLVAQRGDRIVILADAEPPDSPDYSPPGEVYEEAPDVFRQTFLNLNPQSHGPYQDRWGDWITGLAAIPAADGGPALAVLGVDIGAGQYLQTVSGYRRFALMIALLFVISMALSVAVLWMMRFFNDRLQSDLDELRRTQERLRLAAAVIDSSAEGVMVTDARLRIQSVNKAFEKITGYAVADAVGHTPRILFSGRHDRSFFERLHKQVDAQDSWRGEIWNRRKNGEQYPQQTSISVLRADDGSISHYASVFSDNTIQHQVEMKLREMSSMDGLTGINNRRVFDEVLAREWARALRTGSRLSLLMADIDYFKGYNDRHGHLDGDRCLQRVAKAIHAAANRASDVVARYGGEEFAVILPMADRAAAESMGDKIRLGVAAQAIPHGGSDVAEYVTISVGVATLIPTQTSSPLDLIGAADRALYQAKHAGRNRVIVANDTPSIECA